jgi:hypothetical protein
MHRDLSTTEAPKRSPFLAAFGAVVAAAALVAWFQSGQLHDLLGALAFGAMAPVWYLLPISFTAPIRSEFKRPRPRLPTWAQVLTFAGLLLLFVSVGLRWAA